MYLNPMLVLSNMNKESTACPWPLNIDGEIGKKSKHVFLLTRLVSLQERPSTLWAKTFHLPHTSPLPRHFCLYPALFTSLGLFSLTLWLQCIFDPSVPHLQATFLDALDVPAPYLW
jgi:hypothetical protein